MPINLTIPDIPDQVDLGDLDWTQTPPRLLTLDHLLKLKKYRQNHLLPANERVSKHELKNQIDDKEINYSVAFITFEDDREHCFAYYKGRKHRKHLDGGDQGIVKWIQDQDTGEWYLVKVHEDYEERETHILKHLGIFSEGYHHFSQQNHKNMYHQIMKFVRGKTIFDWYSVKNFKNKISDQVFIHFFIHYMEAILETTNKGVIHNDAHPGNVIYNFSTREATLIDFGRASMGCVLNHNDIKETIYYFQSNIFSCIKDEVAKELVSDIFLKLISCKSSMKNALMDAIQDFKVIGNTMEVTMPSQHDFKINHWRTLTEAEKQCLIKNYLLIDTITLVYEGLMPENKAEQIALQKICIEAKRYFSKLGFYVSPVLQNRDVFDFDNQSDNLVLSSENPMASSCITSVTHESMKHSCFLKNISF
ncbi:MAG: serine/threonine-protein kinase [Gammaproteobacteria bacterium]|nr:serine/threonine-protein kinase [Gammaproteobacteria bacterium]